MRVGSICIIERRLIINGVWKFLRIFLLRPRRGILDAWQILNRAFVDVSSVEILVSARAALQYKKRRCNVDVTSQFYTLLYVTEMLQDDRNPNVDRKLL
jgi:hypothetical protein